MSGESRTELLNWINDILQLNYTKVEQLGSGAAYCQIFDSIFLDLPMSRVNFNASKEYEYLTNFKVLQSAFQKHKIQKPIPVDRLIKCRFQDNLEFFQWVRKFWLENKDEREYDPTTRRKPVATSSTPARRVSSTNGTSASTSRAASTSRVAPTRRVASNSHSSTTSTSTSSLNTSRRATPTSTNTNIQSSTLPKVRRANSISTSTSRATSRGPSSTEILKELELAKNDINILQLINQENEETIKALEIERNFYFNKLRSIEVVNETVYDMLNSPGQLQGENERGSLLKTAVLKIHDLLYSLADGFEVPNHEGEQGDNTTTEYTQSQPDNLESEHGVHHVDMDIDAETF